MWVLDCPGFRQGCRGWVWVLGYVYVYIHLFLFLLRTLRLHPTLTFGSLLLWFIVCLLSLLCTSGPSSPASFDWLLQSPPAFPLCWLTHISERSFLSLALWNLKFVVVFAICRLVSCLSCPWRNSSVWCHSLLLTSVARRLDVYTCLFFLYLLSLWFRCRRVCGE